MQMKNIKDQIYPNISVYDILIETNRFDEEGLKAKLVREIVADHLPSLSIGVCCVVNLKHVRFV